MTKQNGTHRPKFVVSFETQQLADRLKSLQVGDIVSYEELSRLAGENVQQHSARLRSARKMVERDSGFLLAPIRGIGIKRIEPTEQAMIGPNAIQKARRRTNRDLFRMSLVAFDALTDEQKAAHNTAASALGAMELFTRARSLHKLAAAVGNQHERIPVADTLKLFWTAKK